MIDEKTIDLILDCVRQWVLAVPKAMYEKLHPKGIEKTKQKLREKGILEDDCNHDNVSKHLIECEPCNRCGHKVCICDEDDCQPKESSLEKARVLQKQLINEIGLGNLSAEIRIINNLYEKAISELEKEKEHWYQSCLKKSVAIIELYVEALKELENKKVEK
jgi:hypothetical protein